MPSLLYHQDEEVPDQVLTVESGFLARWGLLIIGLILGTIVVLCFFIKFPETISAGGIIHAQNAPKQIIPYTNGRIVKLFAQNGQLVNEGETIAWIESSTDHFQAMRLLKILDSTHEILYKNRPADVSFLKKLHFDNMGILQEGLQAFMSSVDQFIDYSDDGYYSRKRNRLYQDIADLENMERNLEAQKSLLQRDKNLSGESFDMNRRLLADKIISPDDFRREESKFINKDLAVSQIDESIIQSKARRADKLKEIGELDHAFSLQFSLFTQELLKYRSTIAKWVKDFVISAPTSGRVIFSSPIQENEYVSSLRVLGYVSPNDPRYYAQLFLPQRNFGRIAIGQKVKLRLEAFPFEQYGQLDGKISYISSLPSDTGFLSNIEILKNINNTARDSTINFTNGMKVTGYVITKDMLIVDRLFNSLRKEITTP